MFTCVRSSSLYSVMSAVDSRGSLKRPLLLQPPWGEWEHVFFSGLFFFGGDSCMWTLSRRAISTVTFDTLLGSVWQGWSAKISVVLHYRPPGAVEEHCYPLFIFFSRGVLVETRKFPLTHQQPLVSRAGPAVSDFLVKSVAERPIAAFRSVLHTKCMQNKRWATNLCFPEDRWGRGVVGHKLKTRSILYLCLCVPVVQRSSGFSFPSKKTPTSPHQQRLIHFEEPWIQLHPT